MKRGVASFFSCENSQFLKFDGPELATGNGRTVLALKTKSS